MQCLVRQAPAWDAPGTLLPYAAANVALGLQMLVLFNGPSPGCTPSGGDDFLQAGEGAATHEQDVGGVDLQELQWCLP